MLVLKSIFETPTPRDHASLGGWGPGAEWYPKILEYDTLSTTSSCVSNENSSTMTLNDQPSTNTLSRDSTILSSRNSFQTAARTGPVHCKIILPLFSIVRLLICHLRLKTSPVPPLVALVSQTEIASVAMTLASALSHLRNSCYNELLVLQMLSSLLIDLQL